MKRLGKQLNVIAIVTLTTLGAGYASAQTLFEHSRDAREFQYQRTVQPAEQSQSQWLAQVPLFEHSRDAREARGLRQARSQSDLGGLLNGTVFGYSKDARETGYQPQ